MAVSPRDKEEMVRPVFGRVTSSVLVQIHVEAYMLTLGLRVSKARNPHQGTHFACKNQGHPQNLPVNTSARETSPYATSREPILFKMLDIPRLNTRRAKEDPTTLLKGSIEPTGLRRGRIPGGVEPVHRVHYLNGDG